MLHLAIISIVCAVSAPNEGAPFIGQKNSESVFCRFEGEQNVAKPSLPNYNADVYNSSNCAKPKITNRTSSFFYDSIVKQYQDSKNSSCSIVKKAFLEKEKKLHSNVEFAFRKRNLLWVHRNSKFSTKTLRPIMDDGNFNFKKLKVKQLTSKKSKSKIVKNLRGNSLDSHNNCNLNCEQKRMLLRLKKIERRPEKEKFHPNYLDRIKVIDELDLNKRIEKLIKKIASENQLKKKHVTNDYAFIKGPENDRIGGPFQEKKVKDSFFNSIKKLFCFHNKFFKRKKKRNVGNVVNSFPVNKVRRRDPVAEKVALGSSFDVPKTKRKTTRLKRNSYCPYYYLRDPAPIFRRNIMESPYPYSVNFMTRGCFLRPPGIRKVYIENERLRPKPRNSLESWPFFKKLYFDERNVHDSRLKRYDLYPEEPSELPATNEEGNRMMSSFENTQEDENSADKTLCSAGNAKKSLMKENDFDKMTKETILPSLISSDDVKERTTVNLMKSDITEKDDEDDEDATDNTIEKPFLERDMKTENFEYFKQDPNFEAYESPYNFMTDSPIFDRFQPNPEYIYERPNYKYIRPVHYLKIRRALRNYFFQNNIWNPFKRRLSFEGKKRCERNCCSLPRKCWRSAPLLCMPYIKKSQEDVIKYLIKFMEKMLGKPMPPKRDIFEKIKYKPYQPKNIFPNCDTLPEEEIYECECENGPASPSFYSEYLDMCPSPPQAIFRSDSKPFSSPFSSSSSCSLTSKVCSASPYPVYFEHPNTAAVNPDFIKFYSYGNFNPSPLNRCPGFNSWPSEVPLFVPYVEQMPKLNPAHFEEKSVGTSQKSTFSVLASTTPATTNISETNVSNSSQVVVSVPLYSNNSDLKDHKTSFLPKTMESDFNALPPQPESTTVAQPTTSTDIDERHFEIASSTSSIKTVCPDYVSNSPLGQEEQFSFTAITYSGDPECYTETYQNAETISSMPLDQQPISDNPIDSQTLNCDACFSKAENTIPNTQQVFQWPSTTNPLPKTGTFNFLSPIKETPISYNEQYQTSQERPLAYNQFGKVDRSQEFDSSKNTKKDFKKSFHYDDNFQNENQAFDSDNPQRRFLRMKHNEVSKPKAKSPPTEFLPPYDYYLYDKYPIMRPNDNSNLKLARYLIPQHIWKEYGRKRKTNYNPKPLIRRKRKDYYFDNYNDYFDDSNYYDEDLNKHPESYAKCNTKNYLNSEGTPPSYEMLNELAKAITESNGTKSESTTPISIPITVTTTQLAKSTSAKSLVSSSSQKSETTSNKTVTKEKDNGEKSISQSNRKSSTTPKVFTSKTTSSSETDSVSFAQVSLTTDTVNTKNNFKNRAIDSKKSGKTSFFQSNSKIRQTSKNSKKDSGKEEKDQKSNKDTKTEEEGQIPTTLKSATIIKGQKKSLTKPSPKVYPKVYPESYPSDSEINDTTSASTVTTVKALTENRRALLSSTSKPDIKLQLLAICEGYLEIVKLVKNQNQSTEGDLDADLARYCENIISQSFNNQLEKPKKPELVEFLPENANKEVEMAESLSDNAGKSNPGLQTIYETEKDSPESQLRDKITADILKNPIYTKEIASKRNKNKKVNLDIDSNDNEENNENDIDKDESEDDDFDDNYNDDDNTTKKNEEINYIELETTHSTDAKTEKDNSLKEYLTTTEKKLQRKETEEELSEKKLNKEEIKMLQILRKRKKALLSWLFKDLDKLDDTKETEYFDDDETENETETNTETETPKNSGTVKPKKGEKKSGRMKKNLAFDNETYFPIYAKRYGYDKGGELREVEVLWRKINEKTHEQKIFKNISVLALLNVNREDANLVFNEGHENECTSNIELFNGKKENCSDTHAATTTGSAECDKTLKETSNGTLCTNATIKPKDHNLTYTFISKPDSSVIVGENPKAKKKLSNTTRKTSRKMEVAKDIFQEYTIEFVNYAVYILPIMLTIIFLFCCLCCALHIMKAQQSLKRHRKKKKQYLEHETSDTTEESGPRSKKKKREVRFKKKPKDLDSDDDVDQTRGKKFWNVLKFSSKPKTKLKKENIVKDKKSTLLRFLKGAKEKGDDESPRTDDQSEAIDRRELIALLEEVKKIEMEHLDDKKELKPVQVQYMTQEDNNSVIQRPDVFSSYQKSVFEMPKDYSFPGDPYSSQQRNPPPVEDCELYEDISELTELLPCECTYLTKKSNCLRHGDFSLKAQDRCKRFLKIFRDSGMCHNRPFIEENFVKNKSENRNFIFNKYRSISMDTSEELMGLTQKNAGTEIRLTDISPPFALSTQKNAGILKEIDNLKRQLNSKKNVRLKDDGVLCRL